jgi:hypothetical protein
MNRSGGLPVRIDNIPNNSFYLASYPRSGNTWMIYSLSMLFSAIRAEARSQFQLYPFAYELNEDFYFRAESEIDKSRPLVMKTHETHDIYKRFYPFAKTLYIYRDGRDVLLSYYFYTRLFSDPNKVIYERLGKKQELAAKTTKTVHFEPNEFADFIKVHGLEWANHVKFWLSDPAVFSFRYEDLHRDFAKVLKNIAEYLDIRPSRTIAEVEEEYVKEFKKNFTNDNQSFFRKGCRGDWKNYFNEEHVRLYSECAGALVNAFPD